MDHLFYLFGKNLNLLMHFTRIIRLGNVNCEGVTLFETYSIESLQPNKSNWIFKGDEIPFCR